MKMWPRAYACLGWTGAALTDRVSNGNRNPIGGRDDDSSPIDGTDDSSRTGGSTVGGSNRSHTKDTNPSRANRNARSRLVRLDQQPLRPYVWPRRLPIRSPRRDSRGVNLRKELPPMQLLPRELHASSTSRSATYLVPDSTPEVHRGSRQANNITATSS